MDVSFGSKVRPRTFGCVAMGSALFRVGNSLLLGRGPFGLEVTLNFKAT